MTVVLFVKEFNKDRLHSVCRVVRSNTSDLYVGQEIRIDLTVDAGFGETPESELVGKTVTVDRLQPCEFIGAGVKIFEEHAITKGQA